MNDVVVIGLGPAGLSAALRLAESGRRVLLVAKGEGGFQLSQGTIDVFGYAPQPVTDPLAAIGELTNGHPYAQLGAGRVRDAVSWLRDVLGRSCWSATPVATTGCRPRWVRCVRPRSPSPRWWRPTRRPAMRWSGSGS